MSTDLKPLASGRYFEGPRWRDGRLYMVDSLARTIVAVDMAGGIETVCVVNGVSGGMAVLPNGDFIATSMFDRRLLVYRGGALQRAIDLSELAAGTIDDMIATRAGRLYVGDLGINLLEARSGRSNGKGRLLVVDENGVARVAAEGLSFPNGIALSGDERMLVVAESDGNCLTRYQIADDGSLSNPVRFGAFTGPDGICLDRENATWVSLFDEDAFVRIDLGGRELRRISVTGRRAIACALGGHDRATLFTIVADTTHEDLMRGKSRASLLAFKADAPGEGSP